MKIGAKIRAGFILTAIVTTIVGVIGYYGLSRQLDFFQDVFTTDVAVDILAQQIKIEMLQHRRAEKDFLLNIGNDKAQKKYLTFFDKKASSIKSKIQAFHELVSNEARLPDSIKQQAAGLLELYGSYYNGFHSVKAAVLADPKITPQQGNALMKKHKAGIHQLEDNIDKLAAAAEQTIKNSTSESLRQGSMVKMIILICLVSGVLLVVAIIFMTSRMLNRVILKSVEGLRQTSTQIASASVSVSTASQTLAHGSSEQAAAIEETSSALEEMSSMTRTNAENAAQANQLMTQTEEMVERANASMNQLSEAMQSIEQASQDTGKIIKTIDEIAFQTNLLALNAAVEAARAGEAGAGFAVVADEVRSLAMRAAEAAKNTTSLIEETLNRVKQGAELTGQTNTDFREVASNTAQVAELVGEISAASSEQDQGIDQVSRAVTDMDRVVQENAANAEESAASAEELSAQAQAMEGFVGNLADLVGSNMQGKNRQPAKPVKAETPAPRKALPPADPPATAPHKNAGGGKASDVIPLDEDDFGDF